MNTLDVKLITKMNVQISSVSRGLQMGNKSLKNLDGIIKQLTDKMRGLDNAVQNVAQRLDKMSIQLNRNMKLQALKSAVNVLANLASGKYKNVKSTVMSVEKELPVNKAYGLKNIAGTIPWAQVGKTLSSGAGKFFRATLGKALNIDTSGVADKLQSLKANLRDTFANAFTNMGTKNLGLFSSLLERISGLMNRVLNPENMSKFTAVGAQALGGLLNAGIAVFDWFTSNWPAIKEGLALVLDWLSPKIDWIIAQIPVLRAMWEEAWPTISSVLQTAWSVVSPIMNTIWTLIQIIWEVFKAAWPSIVNIVESAWGALKPIFDKLAEGLQIISGGVNWVAEVLGINTQDNKKSGTYPKSNALGLPYVPYDNYPALLHRGERVLTRAEADQYRTGSGYVVVEKIADSVVIREEADINRLARAFAAQLKGAQLNYGGV